tara:strand:+ start:2578 stop:4620 length:2043 start_codon:yes stop_codon:yes gene_type:complete
LESPDTTFQLDRSEVDGPGWGSHQFPTNEKGITNAAQWAVDYNNQGQNLYVGMNPRILGLDPNKSATDADIACAFFSFADFDTLESIDIARDGMPVQNTATVNTGTIPSRRCHLHWEHETAIHNLTAWKQTQIGIANYFHSDKVIDPRRILRLAGCVNYPTAKKRERGYVAEVVTLTTAFNGETREKVDTVDMHNKYAGTPASVAPGKEPVKGGLGLPGSYSGADVQQLLANIAEGTEWHNNITKLTAHWVARGWSDAEIRLSCVSFTLGGYSHDDTIREVMKAAQGAREKWEYPNPTHEVGPDTATVSQALGSNVIPITWFEDVRQSLEITDFVEETLGRQQMSVIYGESNSGKTFFIMDMAFHVAMGWKWRGLDVDQGAVIYCALEGAHGITNRVAALKLHYRDRIGEEKVQFGVITVGLNLLDPEADTQRLIDAINQAAETMDVKIQLIVIDTLARALAGGNENSPDDMGALVINGDKIRHATNAHISFVHHSGKDQAKGARGHSSLRAATDTEIEIIPHEGLSVATVTKQREYEGGQAYAFSLTQTKVGTNPRGKDITSCIVEHNEQKPEPKKAGRPIKLTTMGLSGLNILRKVISVRGSRHNDPKMPPNKMVKQEQFEEAMRDAGITQTGRFKQQYTRTLENLQNTGNAVLLRNYLWIPDEPQPLVGEGAHNNAH